MLLAVAASSWVVAAQAPIALSVRAAVTRYAAGDATAVRSLDASRIMVRALTVDLDQWIEEAPREAQAHRRAIAAAFALDASWAATRHLRNEQSAPLDLYGRVQPDDPARWSILMTYSEPIVARWVASQLPRAGLTRSQEETFWFAASALAQDAHGWHHLLEGILPAARDRLGDLPRLRLADVVARTYRELGSLRESNGPQRRPGLKHEALPSTVTRKIPEAVRAFDALKTDATLAAEADLRSGYLELRREHWPDALIRLTAAQEAATEPLLRAAANYFIGWIHEELKQPSEAIAAYRRAHQIVPEMRTVATRLSALLYFQHEREEAYAILDRALNARPAPRELLVTIERGDARFMQEWLRQIREAVR